MSRNTAAGAFTVLMVLSIVMGALSVLLAPPPQGFSETQLHMPADTSPVSVPSPPASIAGDTTSRPDISVRILIGQMFSEYGGSLKINITNNDTRAIFLLELHFEWVDSGLGASITVNNRITSRETIQVKALAVPGPPVAGLRDYRLSMRLLQYRNNQWYRMVSGGDEWLSFSQQTIDVADISDGEMNPVATGSVRYYTRVNELTDLDSEAVAEATGEALGGGSAAYDTGDICTIFDWAAANIAYAEDPGGEDVWYSPDETLAARTGDCEDYAMLLAAMVHHAGGTSRVYLTKDHAFAAVYIGNTSADMENATADVREHYNSHVQTHAFVDDAGYWMVADPLGSFHMGGPAVGQVPTEMHGGAWNFTFPESGTLFSIDVTGMTTEIPLWLEPLLWVAFIVIFGMMAIGLSVSAQTASVGQRTLCFICAGEIGEDLYVCPYCKTTYHRHCAFEGAYCRTCGNTIVFPPPPGIQP